MADPESRDGFRYGTRAVRRFVDGLHGAHDPALEAAFTAPSREGMPSIQVGSAEGALLDLLVRLAGARRVVEVGTLAGYSAIHLARGLAPGGRLWTLENEPRHAAVARAHIAAAGLADCTTVVEGDALDRLPELEAEAPFDIVFLDADKGRYDLYGRWAARNLRPGGILLADNAYFFGRLLAENDCAAEAMRRFHREAAQSFRTTCIPTPDGLLMGLLDAPPAAQGREVAP